jgi:glutathione S-transferase
MITLYTFGPWFGLPDGSPFVTKAMLLLKFAGLAYIENRKGYGKAPKGKLPFIEDDGVKIADSTFIRFHIEQKYGFDFDAGLDAGERAIAWAVEKMVEDHLYWALIHMRWCDRANFEKGPARFFAGVPAPIRPLVKALIQRKVSKSTQAHGLGRHEAAEIAELARRDLDAIATILGDKPWLMGEKPCGADAAVFGMVSGILAPIFESPIREAAERLPTLVAYRDRIIQGYFAG